jgi:hypothetical protein
MSLSSEAAWNDLYNGVVEMLGPERAETLMTHLFRYDPSQIVTKSDIVAMKSDIAVMKSDIVAMKADIAGLRSDISGLYRTLIGGFIVLTAAMIGVLLAAL